MASALKPIAMKRNKSWLRSPVAKKIASAGIDVKAMKGASEVLEVLGQRSPSFEFSKSALEGGVEESLNEFGDTWLLEKNAMPSTWSSWN